ncbi:TPA: hypothetical protein DCX16_06105 [bacterium]|nr:hypothetical protein [bacterium]
MKISNIEPLEITKITDLIPERTLELLLRGLGELGATLVVEEKDENGKINRVPLPKDTLKRYWTPLCEYYDHFPSGKHECVTDTQRRAKEIIEKNITKPRVVYCHLGLSVVAIPFVFKGKVIGVLFGGKKRLQGSNIYERLEGFVKKHPSILKEEAVYDGEKEGVKWKGKKFELSEAKGLINNIPEIGEEEFQEEIKNLERAAGDIIKVGKDNYNAESRLKNQQFLSDIMGYFINNYSVGRTSLKDILQPIVNKITEFARAKCSMFLWNGECIITHCGGQTCEIKCSSVSVKDKIGVIEDLIKSKFKSKDEIDYFLTKDLNDTEVLEEIKSLLEIAPDYSIYAKSIVLMDGSKGFFVLGDPKGEENDFDSDCAEFLSLVTERIKSQIDLYLTDETKSEFMSEMTHRLISPMQSIIDGSGYLEEHLKEKYPNDSETQFAIQGIIDGVVRLDHQIKNYYYITTIGKGEWNYNFQSHPIVVLIKKCARRFRPSATNRRIKIITILPPNDIYLFSINKKFQGNLDNSNLSEELLKAFKEEGHLYLQNPTIEVKKKDKEWVIIDGKSMGKYSVINEENRLNIYGDAIDKRTEFDWDTMEMVVSNLLDNAVKYSHFDRDIFIEASFNDAEKTYSISVSDRGLGIDKEEYESILKKYYRGKNMMDPIRWIPGTGIGLFVVDEIIKEHQGKIIVSSELLKGKEKGDVYHTIFEIFLPYYWQKGGKDEENSIY